MSELYGLLGEKLSHSVSPQIHSRVFSKLNLKGYYHLFEVKSEDLKGIIEGFRIIKPMGINVTIPYKIQVIGFIDELSAEAIKIGAVNTLKFQDNKIIGYNTDYFGIGMLFDKYAVEIKNKKAVILGNGGVAVTMVKYLLDNGVAEIKVATRDVPKVKGSSKFSNCEIISYEDIKNIKSSELVVNCTSLGMYPNLDNSPIDKNAISNFGTAVDMIYNPKKTLFLKYAEEVGLEAINGLYMLVGQGVAAQEIWNDIKIPRIIIDEIYKDIEKELEN